MSFSSDKIALASYFVTFVIADETAIAATIVSIDASSGLISGRIRSVIQIPLPGGETQFLPLLPRPPV